MVLVQWAIRSKYRTQGSTNKMIHMWYRKEAECLRDLERSGQPGSSAQPITDVRETFLKSPTKSIASANSEMAISQLTLWRIVLKNLCMKSKIL
ncbi:hypothetical protein NPIL_548831 [Nephila pilipes]|uniref:Uncharacterized protein n=1 Tax=Nephila pilipes TaxID=299642 RepID=A0A8X6R645_NEPPI|nr:hypothetical protein NPIL_548831 [Nephila pilipes]